MRKLSTLVAVLALSALVVPASAAWTEMTSNWNAQGVGNAWGLVSNPTTGTLYAFSGADAKVYNAGTDTWTALTSATNAAYAVGDNATEVFWIDGKIVMRKHMNNYLSIFDPTGNAGAGSWTESTINIGDETPPYRWGQGTGYNPVTGKLWVMATSGPDGSTSNFAVDYDVATGTWGAPSTENFSQTWWPERQGAFVGNTFYKLSGCETVARMQTIASDWGDAPTTAAIDNSLAIHDFGATLGGGNAWGVRQIGVDDTDIYVVGVLAGSILQDDLGGTYNDPNTPPPPSPDGYSSVWSWVFNPGQPYDRGDGWAMIWSYKTFNDMPFAVYDTLTDTWTDLEGLNTGNEGTYRNASMTVADGVVYVQNNGQFFAYSIPEPATMSLLAIGGIGLLIRRRRRS